MGNDIQTAIAIRGESKTCLDVVGGEIGEIVEHLL